MLLQPAAEGALPQVGPHLRRKGAIWIFLQDLDDVIAELAAHHAADLSGGEGEGRLLHLGGDQQPAREEAQIAPALPGVLVQGALPGQGGEVLPRPQPGQDGLGLLLRGHQDVPGVHMLGRGGHGSRDPLEHGRGQHLGAQRLSELLVGETHAPQPLLEGLPPARLLHVLPYGRLQLLLGHGHPLPGGGLLNEHLLDHGIQDLEAHLGQHGPALLALRVEALVEEGGFELGHLFLIIGQEDGLPVDQGRQLGCGGRRGGRGPRYGEGGGRGPRRR